METNQRKCKRCLYTKTRIATDKIGTLKKDTRYVDQYGKIWNGNLCPECNKVRAKSSMKKTRHNRKKNEAANPN